MTLLQTIVAATLLGTSSAYLLRPARNLSLFSQKTILITGPTLGGIGYALASNCASRGSSKLILLGRSPKKLNDAKDSLKGVEVQCVICDFSEPESVEKACEEIKRGNDRIDVIINNAGGKRNSRKSRKSLSQH